MAKIKPKEAQSDVERMVQEWGLDITRTAHQKHHDYAVSSLADGTRPGMFLAFDQQRPNYVLPCAGIEGELFVGIAGPASANGFSVTLLCGEMLLYTSQFDPQANWQTRSDCLVVLGRGGVCTVGNYPDDFYASIGRVVHLPTGDDPFLGLTVKAWG
ncbi:MAG: hypothetical protein WC551_08550 [Patescibacteria group bacterium]